MKRPNPRNVNPYDSKAYKRTKEYILNAKKNKRKARNPYKN